MKLPRDLAGQEVARLLARHYGYRVMRNRGSHTTATLTIGGNRHSVTVPRHREVRVGTLDCYRHRRCGVRICPGKKYAKGYSVDSMHQRTLTLILAFVVQATFTQSPARLIVTVVDEGGAPVAGLTREDFTVRAGGVELGVVDVEPRRPRPSRSWPSSRTSR